MAVFLYFFVSGLRDVHYELKAKEAFVLSASGYKTKCLNLYDSLYKTSILNSTVMLNYANQLYLSNKLITAKTIVEEAKHFYTDNELYLLSGLISQDLGNYKQAAQEFKTAVYMVPNRMKTRFLPFSTICPAKGYYKCNKMG